MRPVEYPILPSGPTSLQINLTTARMRYVAVEHGDSAPMLAKQVELISKQVLPAVLEVGLFVASYFSLCSCLIWWLSK